MTEQQKDLVKGVFFGQAIGDALGLGGEFLSKEQINKFYPNGLNDYSQIIQDEHRIHWEIGDWTDDTDQFLCICDSILEKNIVDEVLFANKLFQWFKGSPMGIGNTVYKVVSLPQFTKYPHKAAELIWKLSNKKNAANGAIMRTSILGTFDFWDDEKVIENTIKIAKVTHWDDRCVGSCVVLTLLISNILKANKFLTMNELCEIANKFDERIAPFIVKSGGSLKDLCLDESASLGYTLKAMSAGFWAYFHSNNFEEGLLEVVNQGGDADTNACIAGSILGAKFGFKSIPEKFLNGLLYREELEQKFQEYINLLEMNYLQFFE